MSRLVNGLYRVDEEQAEATHTDGSGGGTMAKMTRRRWHTPDMAEAAGRAVRLDAIADGHDENADDCWQVWLDGLDEDEAGTLASDEEIRAAFARGWSEGRQGRQ